MAVKITGADRGSPAEREKLTGTTLLSIDGNEIHDMLDYEFFSQGASLELSVMRAGALQYIHIDKEEYEPLGCCFQSYLIDKKHSCCNKCIFCFIDQLPKGLRDTLYFKDDDERLSFLFGNYVTLTNLSEREVDRIKAMHISPINISVHTVDPDLRVLMMKNKNAGKVLRYIDEFAAAGIDMNCQLVLCRGVNDGDKLRESIEKLASLYPHVKSVAAVPAGLTRYREKLHPLIPYDAQSAGEVLDILEEYGEQYKNKYGVRIVYPGDEWFLLAQRPIPKADYYDDYLQLENGVGMWRRFHDEFMDALGEKRRAFWPRRADVVTGELAYPLIKMLMDTLCTIYPQVHVQVHMIKNDFFGGNVTVAGLVTGGDIQQQVRGKLSSHTLFVPEVMLREERDKFLDDVTLSDLEKALHVKVRILPQDGGEVVRTLLR